jgi:signal transduction histidine kinase
MVIALHLIVIVLYIVQRGLWFYESFFLAAVLPLLSSFVLLAITHLVYERYVLVRLAAKERQATRDRIARDLHDDIASTLGSAGIYLDLLKRTSLRASKQQKELISKAQLLLASASDAMTDIVWTVATRHDSLGDLLARIRILLADACAPVSLKYDIRIGNIDEKMLLTDIVRRNLFLIFKEASTNSIRHSGATQLLFTAEGKNAALIFSLQDYGRGFLYKEDRTTSKNALHGNGLVNMHKRAEEIGAHLQIESYPGKGTVITVRLKIK